MPTMDPRPWREFARADVTLVDPEMSDLVKTRYLHNARVAVDDNLQPLVINDSFILIRRTGDVNGIVAEFDDYVVLGRVVEISIRVPS